MLEILIVATLLAILSGCEDCKKILSYRGRAMKKPKRIPIEKQTKSAETWFKKVSPDKKARESKFRRILRILFEGADDFDSYRRE